MKDFISLYLPQESEQQHDVSINISHDTSPLPSEMDSGPKRKNLDQAILLLRSAISNSQTLTKSIFETVTSYIETIIPPQLHEEINYTTIQNIGEMSDNKLSSNLILRKKIHSVEVYGHLRHLINLMGYSIHCSSDFIEWVIYIGSKVFIYMLADHQAPYAYNVLNILEEWLGFSLQRLRYLLIVYSLIQYRNHQANHINIIYFVIAYVSLRTKNKIIQRPTEAEFLRLFMKENMDLTNSLEDRINEQSIFPNFYINQISRRNIDSNLHYLIGVPQSFEEIGQEICHQLIKGNIQHVESYHNMEYLPLLTYYLDPTEPMFLSPIEFQSIPYLSSKNVLSLFTAIKKLSTVSVSKDKKTVKESAFLYWSLGNFYKLEMLLPPDQAFYAINKLLDNLKPDEALEAIKIMKRLFIKTDFLMMIEISVQYIQPLFKTLGIFYIRNELKSMLDMNNHTDKSKNNHDLSNMNLYNNDKPWMIPAQDTLISKLCALIPDEKCEFFLNQFVGLIGPIKINKKVHNNTWISVDISELDGYIHVTKEIKVFLQEILKSFWFIKISGNLRQNKDDLASAIRLLAFIDLDDKNRIYKNIVDSL